MFGQFMHSCKKSASYSELRMSFNFTFLHLYCGSKQEAEFNEI